jgi:hypothetical protein
MRNLRRSFEKYVDLVKRTFESKGPKASHIEPPTPLMLVVNPAWQIQGSTVS